MPTSYVYLTGMLELRMRTAGAGTVSVQFSDNNGLDWQDVALIEQSGARSFDLQPLVLRRYDYRLRLVMR